VTQVRSRQRQCRHLFQSVLDQRLGEGRDISWTSEERVTFARRMEIWSVPAENALALRDSLLKVDMMVVYR
jgi:hypothetical protein